MIDPIPIFIISFNRLTVLKQTIKSYHDYIKTPFEIIIWDTGTTFLKTVDYLKGLEQSGIKVYRENKQRYTLKHHLYAKLNPVIKDYFLKSKNKSPFYIVTDPDLDLTGIPDDFLSVLEEGLRRYPQFNKCGFSLEINDLPNQVTIDWESRYWQKPLDSMYFSADIDTTFALYKVNRITLSGIRTNRPYTAKHVPWYYDLYDKLPEDELYYYHTQSADIRAHSNILDRKPGRW